MCDYSLHLVASRPAMVGDKLTTTEFAKSITRGFAAVGEPEIAVCLLPGTELAFEDDIQYDRALSFFGKARVNHRVARFCQVNMNDPHVHHDALEFPDGEIEGHSLGRRPDCHGAPIAGRGAASGSQNYAADKRRPDRRLRELED